MFGSALRLLGSFVSPAIQATQSPAKPMQVDQDLWYRLTGLSQMPSLPQAVLDQGEASCLFSEGKKVKESHILICVPEGFSLCKLFQLCGKSTDFLNEEDLNECAGPYWCYVYMGSFGKFLGDKDIATKVANKEHEMPTLLEVGLAIWAYRSLKNEMLFEGEQEAVLAQDSSNKLTAIGADSSNKFFSLYSSSYQSYGTAPVIRFSETII